MELSGSNYIALLKKTKIEIQQDKLIESCCELSSILMQQRNNPHKDLTDDIENKLADVLLWSESVADNYDGERINRKIAKKLYKHKKIL